MDEDERRSRHQGGTEKQSLDLPPAAQQEQAFNHGRIANYYHKHKSDRFLDIPYKDRLIIIITAGAVIIAVATAFILKNQADIMNATLREIRGSGHQTERALILQRGQTLQAMKQAAAAQDSVKAIRQQMRQDQRSWLKFEIGGKTSEVDPEKKKVFVTVGQPLSISISFRAMGKTPVRKIAAKSFVEIVDSEKEPSLDRVEGAVKFPHSIVRSGILYPPDHIESPVVRMKWTDREAESFEPDPVTRPEFDLLTSGKAYLAVYGIVIYEDSFGTRHWTKYCNWIPVSKGAGSYNAPICTAYDATDNN